ncbi:hypothetical protein DER44DRAFT_750944 [Fusarium oxysporum]|nr:hypothetical protein DER44DRAFT_750944 [Fusarium oxysporum]
MPPKTAPMIISIPSRNDGPRLRFKANLRCESGKTLDNGQAANLNQIWEFYAVPGFDTRVVIKSSETRHPLFAEIDGNEDQCKTGLFVWNAAAQWYLEGGDIEDVTNGTIIRLHNVRWPNAYLDLSCGDAANGTAFLVWPGNGGANQAFQLRHMSRGQ